MIIHLAGNTSHSKSFEKPLQDVDSNTKSTLFMLEKIRQLKFSVNLFLEVLSLLLENQKNFL